MPSLSDLPVELLLDHLLPVLPVRDLLALGASNHRYAGLCYDETFWKMKCKEVFNFSSARTARTKGWKFIYKGLSNPKVFVWGSSSNGRLGNARFPRNRFSGALFPVQLHFPKNSAIVDLIAGAWSFHALDSWGRVYVWGTMDGEMFGLQSDGFSVAEKASDKPLRLELPEPVRALSCGRKHSLAFDAKGQIWNFISWGRPFRLVTPALDNTSPEATPVQIECGWSYNAALTASGDVFVWWPYGETILTEFARIGAQMDTYGDKRAHATSEGTIPCATWDLQHNPQKLPAIPSLPELKHTQQVTEEEEKTKLVKIAAMDEVLIGLTNKGHLLRIVGLSNETSVQHALEWEYLPFFSEAEKIRSRPVFTVSERTEGKKSESDALAPPENVQITHITAHFRNFVAYTHEDSSIVLQGTINSNAESEPEILPELQYRKIISVSLADYHSAALTADGKLLTWGAFQAGGLGLGVPEDLPAGAPGGYATQEDLENAQQGARVRELPNVKVPTEVRFDHGLKKKKERFCFAASAAGWHTGALVIDLDPEGEDEAEAVTEEDESDPTRQMPGHFNGRQFEAPSIAQHVPGQMPFIPLMGQVGRGHHAPFRVGHAGRGAFRGRGRGDGN